MSPSPRTLPPYRGTGSKNFVHEYEKRRERVMGVTRPRLTSVGATQWLARTQHKCGLRGRRRGRSIGDSE